MLAFGMHISCLFCHSFWFLLSHVCRRICSFFIVISIHSVSLLLSSLFSHLHSTSLLLRCHWVFLEEYMSLTPQCSHSSLHCHSIWRCFYLKLNEWLSRPWERQSNMLIYSFVSPLDETKVY